MGAEIIRIKENGKILEFSYEDLLKSHGNEMPGGVALVFRLLEYVFSLEPQDIPERGTCSFYSGLGENGKGIIDGADFVLQVHKEGKLFLDLSYCRDKKAPPAPGGGKYYFEVGFNGKLFAVSVKEGVIPQEFFDFSKYVHEKNNRSEELTCEERERLKELRSNLASLIMNSSGAELFEAERLR